MENLIFDYVADQHKIHVAYHGPTGFIDRSEDLACLKTIEVINLLDDIQAEILRNLTDRERHTFYPAWAPADSPQFQIYLDQKSNQYSLVRLYGRVVFYSRVHNYTKQKFFRLISDSQNWILAPNNLAIPTMSLVETAATLGQLTTTFHSLVDLP